MRAAGGFERGGGVGRSGGDVRGKWIINSRGQRIPEPNIRKHEARLGTKVQGKDKLKEMKK